MGLVLGCSEFDERKIRKCIADDRSNRAVQMRIHWLIKISVKMLKHVLENTLIAEI